MGGYDQVPIIEALSKVEASQRQGVAESTNLLVTPDMGGQAQFNLGLMNLKQIAQEEVLRDKIHQAYAKIDEAIAELSCFYPQQTAQEQQGLRDKIHQAYAKIDEVIGFLEVSSNGT
jgi:hypothetical protein